MSKVCSNSLIFPSELLSNGGGHFVRNILSFRSIIKSLNLTPICPFSWRRRNNWMQLAVIIKKHYPIFHNRFHPFSSFTIHWSLLEFNKIAIHHWVSENAQNAKFKIKTNGRVATVISDWEPTARRQISCNFRGSFVLQFEEGSKRFIESETLVVTQPWWCYVVVGLSFSLKLPMKPTRKIGRSVSRDVAALKSSRFISSS